LPGADCRLKGKTVKVRRGPAAVSEDEHRMMPLFRLSKREGTVIRKIHKPEDLPGEWVYCGLQMS